MSATFELTPQERLAISRKAIVRHMKHDDKAEHEGMQDTESDEDQAPDSGSGRWGMVKKAMRSWWYHHPANVALDVAKPVIGTYAREHPFKVLGIAAGIGAVVVVLKPWRLVSMGGLLLATMKSSDITGIVMSMLSPSPEDNPREKNEFQ